MEISELLTKFVEWDIKVHNGEFYIVSSMGNIPISEDYAKKYNIQKGMRISDSTLFLLLEENKEIYDVFKGFSDYIDVSKTKKFLDCINPGDFK